MRGRKVYNDVYSASVLYGIHSVICSVMRINLIIVSVRNGPYEHQPLLVLVSGWYLLPAFFSCSVPLCLCAFIILFLNYLFASIFLFIRVAVTAAEKPLSMLATVTPAEQLFIIVKRAESPSKLEP